MTQTDRIYTSNQNGNTAQEWINIDLIKLLKDEIAFLRDELYRELRSNQKAIKVFSEQNSYYKTHQRIVSAQNQSISCKNC